MSRFLFVDEQHPCPTPSLREMRKRNAKCAEWECDCGQVWVYLDTWAGDGWSRK